MQDVSFRVAEGDKVGLVGRNGAGKTTLTKILAGEGLPAAGRVEATGTVGYLPQDPRTAGPRRRRPRGARARADPLRAGAGRRRTPAASGRDRHGVRRPRGPGPGHA